MENENQNVNMIPEYNPEKATRLILARIADAQGISTLPDGTVITSIEQLDKYIEEHRNDEEK